MASELQFVAFLGLKVILAVAGGLLTIVSYRTYTRNRQLAFKLTTFAFAMVTLGALVEGIYALVDVWLHGSYRLIGPELIAINSAESVLILVGFGFFFYSIHTIRPD